MSRFDVPNKCETTSMKTILLKTSSIWFIETITAKKKLTMFRMVATLDQLNH